MHHDPTKSANNTIYYASLDGKENRPLFRSQTNAIYADGFILFGRGDQLMAQAFNPSSGKLSSSPQNVLTGVMNDAATWHMDASASEDGLLILPAAPPATCSWSGWATTQNRSAPSRTRLQTCKVASFRRKETGLRCRLTRARLTSGCSICTRLTFGPVGNTDPLWSPDGAWIAYVSARDGRYSIYRKHSDGSGAEELLVSDQLQIALTDWSRDGKFLLYSRPLSGVGPIRETWSLPLEGDRKPALVLDRGGNAKLSLDGHWLAFQSANPARFKCM